MTLMAPFFHLGQRYYKVCCTLIPKRTFNPSVFLENIYSPGKVSDSKKLIGSLPRFV